MSYFQTLTKVGGCVLCCVCHWTNFENTNKGIHFRQTRVPVEQLEFTINPKLSLHLSRYIIFHSKWNRIKIILIGLCNYKLKIKMQLDLHAGVRGVGTGGAGARGCYRTTNVFSRVVEQFGQVIEHHKNFYAVHVANTDSLKYFPLPSSVRLIFSDCLLSEWCLYSSNTPLECTQKPSSIMRNLQSKQIREILPYPNPS